MNLFKALIPGSLITWLVSSAIGSQGSRGAWLAIERYHMDGHNLYWSWSLFMIATGLSWALFTLTPK